jgi:hypothetical protein
MNAATKRRRELLVRLAEMGGWRAVAELMDWIAPPGDTDPVRTLRLKVATMRSDLRTLVGRGKAEVERTPLGGTVRLRYRAKEKV